MIRPPIITENKSHKVEKRRDAGGSGTLPPLIVLGRGYCRQLEGKYLLFRLDVHAHVIAPETAVGVKVIVPPVVVPPMFVAFRLMMNAPFVDAVTLVTYFVAMVITPAAVKLAGQVPLDR